jgi:hypothetical protein
MGDWDPGSVVCKIGDAERDRRKYVAMGTLP